MDAYGRSFWRTACLVVLGFLAIAAPASADWVEPVTAPLNGSQASGLWAPAITDLNGSAYAALEEDSSNGAALVVMHQVGSTWQQVGGALSTALTGAARIAAVDGTLYVVWTQPSAPASGGSSPGQVMVDDLSGKDTWVPAGPQPLNLSAADDAIAPSIAAVNGVPYVAFAEAASSSAPHRVVVEQYDVATTSWSQVGASLLYSSGDDVGGTSLASVSGMPYVAWSEANLYSSQIDAASDTAGTWTASQVQTSSQLPGSSDVFSAPDLAAAAGTLYLAYNDAGPNGANADVVELSGGTWSAIAAPANDLVDALWWGPSIPSIAAVSTTTGTTVDVALIETGLDGDEQTVVRQLGAGTWTTVGTALTNPATDTPFDVSIASVGGVPFVAWIDACSSNMAGPDAYVAEFNAGAPSDTLATSCPAPPGPLTIPATTFAPAFAGVSYSITLAVSGGFPPYTWSANGLPPGLTLNPSTGVVSGTPTAAGSYTVAFTVTDSDGYEVQGTLNLPINPAPVAQTQSASTTSSTTGAAQGAAPVADTQSATTTSSTTSAARGGQLANTGTVAATFKGVTLPGAALSMAANGIVTVTLGCPRATPGGRCRGVGALYGATGMLPASVAAAARTRSAGLLGRNSFSIAAGHGAGEALALAKSVQREVSSRRHVGARLVVTSVDAAGQRRTQTLSVTIRLASKR
jgi:hypothetical protein